MENINYYKCNKCGICCYINGDKLIEITCVYNSPVRISGICGGILKESTKEAFDEQEKEFNEIKKQ